MREGLISQTFPSGAGMHLHFSRVKRGASFRREGSLQGSDLTNSQERIHRSYLR